MRRWAAAWALLAVASVAARRADDPRFGAVLSGRDQVPVPVGTVTSGTVRLHVDAIETELTFELYVRDAVGVFAAHLHCGPPGENGPIVAFLLDPVPGAGLCGRVQVGGTLTDGDIVGFRGGGSVAAVVRYMRAGEAYVNVHSHANPAGEIRGQVTALG